VYIGGVFPCLVKHHEGKILKANNQFRKEPIQFLIIDFHW